MNSKPSTLLYILGHLEDLLKLIIIAFMVQFQGLSKFIQLFSKKLSGAGIRIIIDCFPSLIITLQSHHSLTLQLYILTPKNYILNYLTTDILRPKADLLLTSIMPTRGIPPICHSLTPLVSPRAVVT